MLNIGSYSRAFNFSGNKKRNHSNRTSCAARHENEKSFIGGKLSRPHFPSIGHLCFSGVSSHRRHSFLLLILDEPSAQAGCLRSALHLLGFRRSKRAVRSEKWQIGDRYPSDKWGCLLLLAKKARARMTLFHEAAGLPEPAYFLSSNL
jgi:hypothetical protein